MDEKLKKQITIPSPKDAEYNGMAEYVDAYINAVEDVLCGKTEGVENVGANDIDYQFIFDKIKYVGRKYFPEDYNCWPVDLTSQRDLVELYDRITTSYACAVAEPRLQYTCKDCGETFYLYTNDLVFYKEHGYALPKRCKKCRKQRRVDREVTTAVEDAEEKYENE